MRVAYVDVMYEHRDRICGWDCSLCPQGLPGHERDLAKTGLRGCLRQIRLGRLCITTHEDYEMAVVNSRWRVAEDRRTMQNSRHCLSYP